MRFEFILKYLFIMTLLRSVSHFDIKVNELQSSSFKIVKTCFKQINKYIMVYLINLVKKCNSLRYYKCVSN